MHSEYIEERHGGYYLAGTRISLDSVVYSFNEGQSPEAIQEDFPSLKREFEGTAVPLEQANPSLWAKIQRAKADAAQVERRA